MQYFHQNFIIQILNDPFDNQNHNKQSCICLPFFQICFHIMYDIVCTLCMEDIIVGNQIVIQTATVF